MSSILQRRRVRPVVVPIVSDVERWWYEPPPRRLQPPKDGRSTDHRMVWLIIGIALAVETAVFAVACLIFL